MSLDTVVEDIREQARARAEEIRESAEDDAADLIEAAEADAERIREERRESVAATIEQEREQQRSSAKLEAKQARLEARRDVLEEVREGVESELATLPDEERAELTRALLAAGAEEFDDADDVSVYGRAADADLLEDLADEYGFTYGGEYDCLGGVVLESEQSRVRVNNSFDSILADVWEDELREASDRLFEQ